MRQYVGGGVGTLRFAPGDRQGRDSAMGAAMPMWANGAPEPARVTLIRGKAELGEGSDIIERLDSEVNSKRRQVNVGESEWEMVTFSEKRRWASRIVPTVCSYSKLNGCFAKLRGSEIERLQSHGDFGGVYYFGKSTGRKSNCLKVEWHHCADFGHRVTGRGAFSRSLNTTPGRCGGGNGVADLRGI